jgi:hypothetical protein
MPDSSASRCSIAFHNRTRAPIAATPVGGDQHLGGHGIDFASHAIPPTPEGLDGEFRRVMGYADTDPTLVASDVVDRVRDGLAETWIDKIVQVDVLRLAPREHGVTDGLPLTANGYAAFF